MINETTYLEARLHNIKFDLLSSSLTHSLTPLPNIYKYMYMCVCVYICMYVRMYVCMYISMEVCAYICMCAHLYVCMYISSCAASVHVYEVC